MTKWRLMMVSGVAAQNNYCIGEFYDYKLAHRIGYILFQEDRKFMPEYTHWEVVELDE